ncbi:hypothetical protein PXK47_02365 [Phaeobacter gallaeciensis]|nr:hypothetical protein [Phaeobacter gallaeciensis]
MNLILVIIGPFPTHRTVWFPNARKCGREVWGRTWPGIEFSPAQYGCLGQQVPLLLKEVRPPSAGKSGASPKSLFKNKTTDCNAAGGNLSRAGMAKNPRQWQFISGPDI